MKIGNIKLKNDQTMIKTNYKNLVYILTIFPAIEAVPIKYICDWNILEFILKKNNKVSRKFAVPLH